MSDLIFALPSKGRIRQEARDFFDREFFSAKSPRALDSHIAGIQNLRIVFLPASEIAHQLRQNEIHIGLTGADLIYETSSDWQDRVDILTHLPFAYARLVVAVPQSWIDVDSMEDLEDVVIDFRKNHGRRMRFATKYPHLTRDFFSKHMMVDYRLIESLGATEAAPSLNLAEAICDLTSSGSTLKANGLKTIQDGIIIKSQAVLCGTKIADWDNNIKQTARILLKKMNLDQKLKTPII